MSTRIRTALSRSWRGRPVAVWVVVGLLGFLGIRGSLGGAQFLIVPSGELAGLSPAPLAGTPFSDYLVPGVVLLIVFGITPLAAAGGLLRRANWARQTTLFVALALTAWVVVEAAVFGLGARLQLLNLLTALVLFEVGRSGPVRTYVE